MQNSYDSFEAYYLESVVDIASEAIAQADLQPELSYQEIARMVVAHLQANGYDVVPKD